MSLIPLSLPRLNYHRDSFIKKNRLSAIYRLLSSLHLTEENSYRREDSRGWSLWKEKNCRLFSHRCSERKRKHPRARAYISFAHYYMYIAFVCRITHSSFHYNCIPIDASWSICYNIMRFHIALSLSHTTKFIFFVTHWLKQSDAV